MEVTYIDHMGNDARVATAARVSFSKEAENYSEQQNDKLIKYLARYNHFTPFTHPQITLREKVPIFVARQRFKHMIGFSYNEVSRRYVDDTPDFYIPDVWRSRPEASIKQGSGTEEITHLDLNDEREVWDDHLSPFLKISIKDYYNQYIEFVEEFYDLMIKNEVAPEQARMILPQSMYTEYVCTGSLAAFARAYNLRSEKTAQIEVQELAKEWDRIIRPLFPVSWSALVDETYN